MQNPNAEVLVLDDNGTNLGRMPYRDAKLLSINRNLDLVEINKNGTFKIMDHGKYKYEKNKNKQKKTVHPLKEMTFTMKIDPHDAEIKIDRIKSFLSRGSEVKITVAMRGRERAFPNLAQEKMDFILKKLADLVIVQQNKSERNSIFVTVRPAPVSGKHKHESRRNDSVVTGTGNSNDNGRIKINGDESNERLNDSERIKTKEHQNPVPSPV